MATEAKWAEWQERHRQKEADRLAMAFECAICNRRAVPEHYQMKGRERQVPPLCNGCEGGMGMTRGWSTCSSIPPIRHGSHMDRRIARQIAALAEALEVEANRKIWSPRYAS